MALSFPLAWPSGIVPASISFIPRSTVGRQMAPLSPAHTVYAWSREWWEADIALPPLLQVADYEAVISGLLLPLNGQEGTFTMGPADVAGYAGQRGTIDTPEFSGAHAAGVKTLSVKNGGAAKTYKVGDWWQFGTGSSARLHRVVKDGTTDGSGDGTVEIWPATRAAYANGDDIVTTSPVGLWCLASNSRQWDIGRAKAFGVRFACVEALEGL